MSLQVVALHQERDIRVLSGTPQIYHGFLKLTHLGILGVAKLYRFMVFGEMTRFAEWLHGVDRQSQAQAQDISGQEGLPLFTEVLHGNQIHFPKATPSLCLGSLFVSEFVLRSKF